MVITQGQDPVFPNFLGDVVLLFVFGRVYTVQDIHIEDIIVNKSIIRSYLATGRLASLRVIEGYPIKVFMFSFNRNVLFSKTRLDLVSKSVLSDIAEMENFGLFIGVGVCECYVPDVCEWILELVIEVTDFPATLNHWKIQGVSKLY